MGKVASCWEAKRRDGKGKWGRCVMRVMRQNDTDGACGGPRVRKAAPKVMMRVSVSMDK